MSKLSASTYSQRLRVAISEITDLGETAKSRFAFVSGSNAAYERNSLKRIAERVQARLFNVELLADEIEEIRQQVIQEKQSAEREK